MRDFQAIIWILDKGVEQKFLVSFCSFLMRTKKEGEKIIKVVFDVGISKNIKHWISGLGIKNLFLLPIRYPRVEDVVGEKKNLPAQVMRIRVNLTNILKKNISEGILPDFDTFLHVDSDTAFWSSPIRLLNQNWEGEHIRIAKSWDWIGDAKPENQILLKLNRDSTYIDNSEDRGERLAKHLGISLGELNTIYKVNTGVWMSIVGSKLSENWEFYYKKLQRIDKLEGGNFLNPHSAEENALSLAIYFGKVTVRFLPRKLNTLAPKPPEDWPKDTCIGHFVTFHKNWRRSTYKKWFDIRNEILDAGLCNIELIDEIL
jgi:hypothetical protein